MQHTRGFTLIELSIVLVIIGLIVGGVLVGQNLVRAAEIRATVGQVEKYNAAANTFLGKYKGLPGDLKNPDTYFNNVTPCASVGLAGCANGNRLIESSYDMGYLAGEPAVFWGMLATVKLTADKTNVLDYTAAPVCDLDTSFPAAKMGRRNRFVVMGQRGANYFILGKFTNTSMTLDTAAISAGLTPVEAYQIDTKMDDGSVNTGTVVGIDSSDSSFQGASYVQGTCATGSNKYDIAANANLVACTLGILSSF